MKAFGTHVPGHTVPGHNIYSTPVATSMRINCILISLDTSKLYCVLILFVSNAMNLEQCILHSERVSRLSYRNTHINVSRTRVIFLIKHDFLRCGWLLYNIKRRLHLLNLVTSCDFSARVWTLNALMDHWRNIYFKVRWKFKANLVIGSGRAWQEWVSHRDTCSCCFVRLRYMWRRSTAAARTDDR